MRMAELSERSGVPVATIKYYRREGLLPPGEATAANQARYGQEHVDRLRLVRALRDVAGLPVAAIREVVAAVDDPARSLHDAVGAAHRALDPGGDDVAEDALARVDAVVERAGWQVSDTAPARHSLARALQALDTLDVPAGPEVLDRYVEAADRVAAGEVAATLDAAGRSREAVVTSVVVGTLLFEPVLASLRRLAHEHHSGRRARPS